jgi:acyl transferase domain-containing protein/acyl carrier protein
LPIARQIARLHDACGVCLSLEQAPPIPDASESRPWQLLKLSTKTPTALETATKHLSEYLKQHPDCNLADVAYTLQVGRKGFSHRRVILAQNPQDAIDAIAARDPQRTFSNVREQFDPTVAFMFPGQGAQYVNMGAQLYQGEPIFRHWLDRCCELLQPHLGFDLRGVLYPTPERTEDAADRLKQTAVTQPALFAIEYAMAQLWMAWGIRPQAAIGHSIGEYVAACLAGVFDLEEALNLVALRGRLMQQCAPGAMLSIFLSEAELEPFLSEKIALAACNSPSACVVSGETEAIAQLETTLRSRGIECRPLQTSHAFHSAMMEDIVVPFAERVRQVRLNPPTLPLISNVTGTWMGENEATDPDYWVRHLRQTIRFSDGIGTLVEDPSRLLLEVGPGRTLSTLAKPHLSNSKMALTSLRHPKEVDDDRAVLLRTLGRLWGCGVCIDWSSFYQQERRRRLPLPTYPFERQRYWIDAIPNPSDIKPSGKIANLDDWFYVPSWKRTPNVFRPSGSSPSRWLVFVDEFGIGTQLVEQLKAQGCEVISVDVAETFRQLDSQAYTIDPENIKDYQTLIRLLKIQKQLPEAIAHVWGVVQSDRSRCGFYSLVFLARAFAEQTITDSIDIQVVTDRACDVTGDEEICPDNATVLGACKVIPQEYPNLSCRYIDTVLSQLNSNEAIARLVRELQSNASDRAVAYRGRSRWVQIFDPISLPANSDARIRLKPEGVYVISGARSGGVGFKIAEHSIETLGAKIVFLGDSNSPEIRRLEQSGADILALEIDLTDPAAVKSALDRAIDRFGRIDGVINAAEVLVRDAVCAIPDTERSRCEELFETKIKSLFALEKGLGDRQVDFVILQSSLSSVLGGLGYAAYSAVHQFVDAFATEQNRRGSTPWISVNWDAWQLPKPKEVSAPDRMPSISATPNEFSMSAAEGLEAFKRIVSAEVTTPISVSTGNLSARIEQWIDSKPQDDIADSQSKISSNPRPKLSENYAAPRNDTERAIAALWQELLWVERVGIHDNFFDLGGHSLLAIRGVSKLRETFQIDLPLRNLLFESPTVAKLATVVEQKQKESDIGSVDRVLQEIENLSPEEVEKHLTRDS